MWKLVVVTLLLAGVSAQNAEQCANKETCGECIQTVNCVWCGEQTQIQSTRCRSMQEIETDKNWCRAQFINNPEHKEHIVRNEEFRKGVGNEDAVQIRPQHIRLQVRPGVPIRIPVNYKQAEDYPVDLYYLMDLSQSMNDDKKSLSALGVKLAEAMQKLTQNFKLGFGSFVDKVEMPFVNTLPEKLKSPCTNCSPPYSFKNHLALTSDVSLFARSVEDTPISGNIDSPEGGFDALMQAMACTQQIGWRPKARHIIVFSTDAESHYAGDGKLAGIVEPNDELCHLDEYGEYTHGLLQDYPSVSQINSIAKKNNMNIIFAVTSSMEKVYQMLSSRVEASDFGVLKGDSSNVVLFVENQYKKLTQGVAISDNAPDNIQVKYFSQCKGNIEVETRSCSGIRVQDVIVFNTEITVLQCPKDPKMRVQRFEIKPEALSESLLVEIEMICDCPCEKQGGPGFEANSRSCNGKGSLQCGVCSCNTGSIGRTCECNALNADRFTDNQDACKPSNTTDMICNGRGDCKCGECVCHKSKRPNEVVYGKYCECDNYSCRKHCSGPEHGECDCGICKCNREWKGEFCECTTLTDTCKAPGSTEICSGKGKCNCGSCECDIIEGQRYNGKYCEDCPTCSGRCHDLKTCVELMAYQKDQNQLSYIQSHCNFTLHIVPDLKQETIAEKLQDIKPGYESFSSASASSSSSSSSTRRKRQVDFSDELETPGERPIEEVGENLPGIAERQCSHADQVGCTYTFSYYYDEYQKLHVFAMEDKECGSQVALLPVVLGVIGTILLAGLLLLLIWKIATTIHDRREYARFEDERKNAKWDRGDNPLYVGATSTFANPTFGGGGNRKSQLPE